MTNDAKLGLVAGVSLVVVVAVVFFRKDLVSAQSAQETALPAAPSPATTLPLVPGGQQRSVQGRAMIQTREAAEPTSGVLYHTVQDGETLFTLAQRYYNDGERFIEIYRRNRDVLRTPDSLPPGTVLVIPDLSNP
jgi:nucleoid-associated protein YgaU